MDLLGRLCACKSKSRAENTGQPWQAGCPERHPYAKTGLPALQLFLWASAASAVEAGRWC